jgi:antitoxin component YwqK of YwqJK toxin-antitoxin module
MKKSFFILFLFATFIHCVGQRVIDYPDSGFTNKAEAKNQKLKGIKEGKWMENENIVADDSNELLDAENHYKLIVYKAGKPYGIVREYYTRSNKLFTQTPYINSHGEKNGVEKEYTENGVLVNECTYVNDKENGVCKVWDFNGILRSEETYNNGIKDGKEKRYDINGKLFEEIIYTNGVAGVAKYYDGSGPYLIGNCQGHNFNSTQTKSLLIGDWEQFIITKDSIFFNYPLHKEHLKYQIDSNRSICNNHANCYDLDVIRDSVNFKGMKRLWGTPWRLGFIDSISNNYLRLYSNGGDIESIRSYQKTK